MGPAVSRPDDLRLRFKRHRSPAASMGPAVSRPDDWNGVPIVPNGVFASMGPAVSRPDDLRPAQAERTAGVASMGPAVSRPDDVTVAIDVPCPDCELQWGRPFHGRMTCSLFAPTASRLTRFNGAGRFTAGCTHNRQFAHAGRSASMGPAVSRPDDWKTTLRRRCS